MLEIAPDSSPQDIREAYLRAKSAYKKDSVALYSLMSEEETQEVIRRIEEAYLILSDPEKRREYDRSHGLLAVDEPPPPPPPASRPDSFQRNVVSIDRMPPMEPASAEMDILVPPSTDFAPSPSPALSAPVSAPARAPTESAPAARATAAPIAAMPEPERVIPSFGTPADLLGSQEIAQEISQEVEWRGSFLRKVREARKISIEEMSDFTKITKHYLMAVEEENYSRLPAPVYLRGFVIQIAKVLKLPHDKVAAAYMARYTGAMGAGQSTKAR